MSDWRTINMNDAIRFKMTKSGKKIWRDYWTPYTPGREPKLPSIDDDGWMRDQLWQVANIFGPHMGNGLPAPIETEIQVDMACNDPHRH